MPAPHISLTLNLNYRCGHNARTPHIPNLTLIRARRLIRCHPSTHRGQTSTCAHQRESALRASGAARSIDLRHRTHTGVYIPRYIGI
jgi:hypothetical protein